MSDGLTYLVSTRDEPITNTALLLLVKFLFRESLSRREDTSTHIDELVSSIDVTISQMITNETTSKSVDAIEKSMNNILDEDQRKELIKTVEEGIQKNKERVVEAVHQFLLESLKS